MQKDGGRRSSTILYGPVEFMSFREEQNYASNTVFTQDQLVAITPSELKRWICV
jgi:hypothetical protein